MADAEGTDLSRELIKELRFKHEGVSCRLPRYVLASRHAGKIVLRIGTAFFC